MTNCLFHCRKPIMQLRRTICSCTPTRINHYRINTTSVCTIRWLIMALSHDMAQETWHKRACLMLSGIPQCVIPLACIPLRGSPCICCDCFRRSLVRCLNIFLDLIYLHAPSGFTLSRRRSSSLFLTCSMLPIIPRSIADTSSSAQKYL